MIAAVILTVCVLSFLASTTVGTLIGRASRTESPQSEFETPVLDLTEREAIEEAYGRLIYMLDHPSMRGYESRNRSLRWARKNAGKP